MKRFFSLVLILTITFIIAGCRNPSLRTYTVTFNTQGIGMAPTALTVAEGSKLITAQTPAPTAIPADKRFEGWFKDAVCTQPWNHNSDTVTADITLYAKWNDILMVTFNVQGIGAAPAALRVAKGSKLTVAQTPLPTDIPANKGFGGWFKDTAGTQAWNHNSDTVTADITLYAKWRNASPLTLIDPSTPLYTVTFNTQGIGTAPEAFTVAAGSKLTAAQIPAPTAIPADKSFVGWFKDTAGMQAWNHNSDTVTKDITLYAKWRNASPLTPIDPSTPLYTVTFNTQGIGTAPEALTVAEGSKLTAAQTPTPTDIPANKGFGGWFKDIAGTQPWNHNSDTVTKDITLYAKWRNASPLTPIDPSTPLYTVTFNTQGIGTAPEALTVAEGSKLTAAQIPAPTAIPADKSFVGWFKNPADTQPWNHTTDTVTKDITLYAKWTDVYVTVTFDVRGIGSLPAGKKTLSILKGHKIPEADMPIPENIPSGKMFDGWYKENTYDNKWQNDTDTVTENTTLYAKWTPNSTVDVRDLWQSKTTPYLNDYYRIPAFAVTNDGTLLAVTDLRYTDNTDLGFNHGIDLLIKRSEDNGKTWSDDTNITKIPAGDKNGYGDAAIVADRESNDVLILCVHGNVFYPNGTHSNHLKVIQFVSNDGGKTFPDSGKKDISDTIFGFNSTWKSLFFGSGRIMQSRYIKAGSHYRIYSALLSLDYGNAVVYSDDFGSTWKLLGDASTSPIPDGNEAKVEELPDGSVLLSSRKNNGRFVSIFTYTNPNTGAGNWSTKETLDLGGGSGTNGEILIVKACKADTKVPVYLAFQSLPDGPGRKNVTIHWRKLTNGTISVNDFISASAWSSHSYLVQDGDSAYSTMDVQRDGGIGFLYERNTRGHDYDIAYKNLPIDVITNGAYEAIFLGTGSVQCPYTDLEGKPVEASVKAYYQKEKLHWKE